MRDLTTACWEGWRLVHSVWICEWLAGRSKLDVDTQFQTLHEVFRRFQEARWTSDLVHGDFRKNIPSRDVSGIVAAVDIPTIHLSKFRWAVAALKVPKINNISWQECHPYTRVAKSTLKATPWGNLYDLDLTLLEMWFHLFYKVCKALQSHHVISSKPVSSEPLRSSLPFHLVTNFAKTSDFSQLSIVSNLRIKDGFNVSPWICRHSEFYFHRTGNPCCVDQNHIADNVDPRKPWATRFDNYEIAPDDFFIMFGYGSPVDEFLNKKKPPRKLSPEELKEECIVRVRFIPNADPKFLALAEKCVINTAYVHVLRDF